MIRTFRNSGLRRLYQRGDKRKINPNLIDAVEEILSVLDVAQQPRDVNFPGYRLHPLKGKLNGFWSITVSGNWRIIFRFENDDVHDIDLVDYH